MKAHLIFDLEDPHDKINHKRCCMALELAGALYDIQQDLFKLKESEHKKYVIEAFNIALESRGINLEELYG